MFTRRDGAIRHFWGGEMAGATADPGQDPRGVPDFDPLWTLLDTTPEGRGKDWYPKLGYCTRNAGNPPHHYGTLSGQVPAISACLTRACV